MFADGYRALLEHTRTRDYTGDPRQALARFLADMVQFCSDDSVPYQLLFQRTIPGFPPTPAVDQTPESRRPGMGQHHGTQVYLSCPGARQAPQAPGRGDARLARRTSAACA